MTFVGSDIKDIGEIVNLNLSFELVPVGFMKLF